MGRRTAALILACALTACGSNGKGPALEAAKGTPSYGYDLIATDVAAVGLPALKVRQNVTIDTVTVRLETGTTQVLLSMVSFVACNGCPARHPSVGYPTVMGALCTDVWPSTGKNGLGPTYVAKRIDVHKHDRPSIVLYIKAPAVHTVIDEVIVAYHVGLHGTRQALHLPVRLDMRVKPKGAKSTCSHDSIWFGGPVGADKVTPLT